MLNEESMRDALITSMESFIEGFADLDSATKNTLRDGLATALSSWLYVILTTDAEIEFAVGTITGADSHGDTHDALSAAGGKIK